MTAAIKPGNVMKENYYNVQAIHACVMICIIPMVKLVIQVSKTIVFIVFFFTFYELNSTY